MGISFFRASFAALTSAAVDGTLSVGVPGVVVTIEVEGALDPEGADIVCRRFGKPVGQDYATDLSVARLIGRVQLRNMATQPPVA